MAKRRRKLTYKAKILICVVGIIILTIFVIGLIQSSYMVYFDANYRKTYVITTKLLALGWLPALIGICLIPTIIYLIKRIRRIRRAEKKRRLQKRRELRHKRMQSKR
jgi:hypothetical protein